MVRIDLRRAEERGFGDVRAFVEPSEEGLKARRIPLEVDPPRHGPDVRRKFVQPGDKRPGLRREFDELRPAHPQSPVERPDHFVPRVGMNGERPGIGDPGVELVPLGESFAAHLFVPPLTGLGAVPPGVHEGVLDPPDPGGVRGVKPLIGEIGLGRRFGGVFANGRLFMALAAGLFVDRGVLGAGRLLVAGR
ncbi:hypothetical protein [Amycolatopsis sp. NPDC004625]|uniref:hypothetical protein n=1 Tax=Amycolatopsis sp. NPDC004625 TaxID=3154670 RepID=UPI0033BC84FF